MKLRDLRARSWHAPSDLFDGATTITVAAEPAPLEWRWDPPELPEPDPFRISLHSRTGGIGARRFGKTSATVDAGNSSIADILNDVAAAIHDPHLINRRWAELGRQHRLMSGRRCGKTMATFNQVRALNGTHLMRERLGEISDPGGSLLRRYVVGGWRRPTVVR